MYGKCEDSSTLVFSLSSHRHSYIGLVFSSRLSIHNKQKHQTVSTIWRSVHEYHVQFPTFPHLFVGFLLRDARYTYFKQFGCTRIFLENPIQSHHFTRQGRMSVDIIKESQNNTVGKNGGLRLIFNLRETDTRTWNVKDGF